VAPRRIESTAAEQSAGRSSDRHCNINPRRAQSRSLRQAAVSHSCPVGSIGPGGVGLAPSFCQIRVAQIVGKRHVDARLTTSPSTSVSNCIAMRVFGGASRVIELAKRSNHADRFLPQQRLMQTDNVFAWLIVFAREKRRLRSYEAEARSGVARFRTRQFRYIGVCCRIRR